MTGKTRQIDVDKIFDNVHDTRLLMNHNDGHEVMWKWPVEIGIGDMRRIKLRSGIALGMSDFQLLGDFEISLYEEMESMPVIFHFYGYLNGDSRITCMCQQNKFCLASPGFGGAVTYLKKWDCAFKYPKGVRIRGLSIYIEPSLLKSFMDCRHNSFPEDLLDIISGDHEKSFIQSFALTNTVNNTINQVFECCYTGVLKRFFLEAKTLELITYAMAQAAVPMNPSNTYKELHPDDINRVRQIKQILLDNLDNPPSLDELARKSGTNKNKLNSDFRMIYGASVFEFFRTSRLEQARDLLKNREMNVTEVAFEVGYAHQQSFTRAFRNYFGANPVDYFK